MLMCKYLKIKAPGTKYQKWKERYRSYSRKRIKPIKERIKLTRGLLRLLQKLLSEPGLIENKNELQMPPKYWDKKEIVAKVPEQQQYQIETGQKIKDRIVSLSKSYVRPIVRGKETKKVEFGAKWFFVRIPISHPKSWDKLIHGIGITFPRSWDKLIPGVGITFP